VNDVGESMDREHLSEIISLVLGNDSINCRFDLMSNGARWGERMAVEDKWREGQLLN
jgi:hypothetical protein